MRFARKKVLGEIEFIQAAEGSGKIPMKTDNNQNSKTEITINYL